MNQVLKLNFSSHTVNVRYLSIYVFMYLCIYIFENDLREQQKLQTKGFLHLWMDFYRGIHVQ